MALLPVLFRHAIVAGPQTTGGEDGQNTRTVQELPGHGDVTTTMIYTYVLNRGPAGVCSPTDRLAVSFQFSRFQRSSAASPNQACLIVPRFLMSSLRRRYQKPKAWSPRKAHMLSQRLSLLREKLGLRHKRIRPSHKAIDLTALGAAAHGQR